MRVAGGEGVVCVCVVVARGACMNPMLPPPPAGAPGAFFSTGSRPTSEGSFGRNMKLATPVMPLSTPGEGEGEGEREGGSAG